MADLKFVYYYYIALIHDNGIILTFFMSLLVVLITGMFSVAEQTFNTLFQPVPFLVVFFPGFI